VALVHWNFFSEALGFCVSADVILPEAAAGRQGSAGRAPREMPCLYLLHGRSDDHTIWQRRTSIERHAAPLGLAVVMPAVGVSFYADMAHGCRYWTFVSEELPRLVRGSFRVSGRREDTFVAGLSMGGYGAFKLALRRPGSFAAAASLSGALDMADRALTADAALRQDMRLAFGNVRKIRGSDNDLFAWAERLAKRRGPKPRLYQCCGTGDHLYRGNVRFRDHARALGLDLTYDEGPGGHDWAYWDRTIQDVLRWLPLASSARRGSG
jgi:S-formylglutathione hydrolase FrmB